MPKNPPSMVTYGRIDHIIEKIKAAKTPDRFTNDFLKEVIEAKGSNDRAFISLAKRCGLLSPDGSPTDRYKRLRSTTKSISTTAMAEAIKQGYSDLYKLNEYAHKLNSSDLEGLVIQHTGDEKGSKTVANIVKTYEALKKHADFEGTVIPEESLDVDTDESSETISPPLQLNHGATPPDVSLGLSYQINLVLPKTDDIAVFNAIFKSLKENLLSS